MSNDGGIGRRDFLKGAAATAALLFTTEQLAMAQDVTPAAAPAAAAGEAAIAPVNPPVKVGVIGLGQWGREALTTLTKSPSIKVTAICDNYPAFLNRGKRVAADAADFSEYQKVLESPEVEAVVIATPSHQHKEIVLAAIQAGKHVYCEAPLASTIDDAKAIALAGQGSKQVFQVGLQGRANELYTHVAQFIKAGALGTVAEVHGQYNKRQSWRRMAPSAEREKETNWRLFKETSSGLLGEIGIHQLDLVNWYLNAFPVAISGYGSIIEYADGRDVPDTVQCVLEYPNNIRLIYTTTLVSSFSADYTLFQGSKSSLMMRPTKGWMVKEADSELLGWEVYAKKETCFEEQNAICMIAGATKLLKAGKEPGKDGMAESMTDPLVSAFESFANSVRNGAAVACGPVEGYQAAVTAIKANEAIVSGTRISCQPGDFELK